MKKKSAGSFDLKVPKGMRDILGENFYHYHGFFEKASEIALYYGFQPIETPMLEQESLFTSGVGEGTDIVGKEMYTLKTKGGDRLALRPEGTSAVIRAYLENGFQSQPQPVMLYYFGPFFRHDKPQRGRFRQFWQFGLETIGSSKSIADALTIKLCLLMLSEVGLSKRRVEINSIGDNECRPAYRRELVNYYKKHLKDLCPDCRERLKINPLRLLDCKHPGCQELKIAAPTALGFLCPNCKAHFKEVLEYLDAMGIEYEINNNLVRGLDYYSRTVFEISEPAVLLPIPESLAETKNPDDPEVLVKGPASSNLSGPLALASGGRYDYLAKALGHKKDLPAVGAAIGVDRVLLSPNFNIATARIIKKPKIFFIQLSYEAKLKSIDVIEILRKARIPMVQTLARDSLTTQLGIAEKLGVPYTIILGQKEALEDTVIVRTMANRSQETVKIARLADYLKALK